MSRSGYTEDYYNPKVNLYRGMVASATRGKRGQKFFADLLAALHAMPEKVLIAHDLVKDGYVCAIGALGVACSIDMKDLDPEDSEKVAKTFDIADCLACEVVYMNDEGCLWKSESPEDRWRRMRDWVESQIRALPDEPEHAVPSEEER